MEECIKRRSSGPDSDILIEIVRKVSCRSTSELNSFTQIVSPTLLDVPDLADMAISIEQECSSAFKSISGDSNNVMMRGPYTDLINSLPLGLVEEPELFNTTSTFNRNSEICKKTSMTIQDEEEEARKPCCMVL